MRLIDATLVLVVVTATAGLTGSRLTAQTATRATGREIERVEFRGVRSVPMEQVQRVLTTRASSVIRRRHLEPGQLASDVAGLHDLYWRHGFRDVAVDTTVSQNQLGPRVLRVRGEDLVANGCTDASIADGSCDPNAVPRGVFSPQPVGATALLEGSVELRKRLVWRLGGVLFADGAVVGPGAGTLAAERVSTVTPGVGLRYETPFGELRLDAGWQPDRNERLSVLVETTAADGSSQLAPNDRAAMDLGG